VRAPTGVNIIMVPSQGLLKPYTADETYQERQRVPSAYNPLYSYRLPRGETKQYQQQFADIYFLRLAKLKPVVEKIAQDEWEDFEIAGEKAQRVHRVLDVRQGQLCWVVGTVYMDLPLKPNILEDISKEHWVAGPPPRPTYLNADGDAQVMLEDESGRLRLAGAMLSDKLLVTGVIIAVLGTENANGDFEVLDTHIAELPPQPQRWQRDDEEQVDEDDMVVDRPARNGAKIALVSGLSISGTAADALNLSLLGEYLSGEALELEDQDVSTNISRLIIAGNSISAEIIEAEGADDVKKPTSKKYGYDASAYNPTPTAHLDQFISELLPSLPVTIMTGETDPANSSMPQQAIHPAMFPHSRAYSTSNFNDPETEEPAWFDSVSNPWEGDIEGWRFMGNSGQPIDDILKYISLGGNDGKDAEGRLEVIEALLRWRCGAPTAPDTLWCYPFQDRDPFVIAECPHVFFVGNQPRFDTALIEGPDGQHVRLIAVPDFHRSGQLVLLDSETLEPEVVQFDIHETHASNGVH
jgi:DNA polymerase delta subunit 2